MTPEAARPAAPTLLQRARPVVAKVIANSRTDWIIVRPGALTNGAPRGRYRHGVGVGSYLRTVRISRADVAAFMLDQLTNATYVAATPGVSW